MWVCSWSKTACSVNFEINCKLLMGLRLENSDVRLGFFRMGVTIVSFQLEGKWPWRREELTIVVMTGRRTSRHEMTSGVGIGSKAQDFFADDWMRLRMAIFVVVVKRQNFLRADFKILRHFLLSTISSKHQCLNELYRSYSQKNQQCRWRG